MATRPGTARNSPTASGRNDNARVREELRHDPELRKRQIGFVVHGILHELARLERPVTLDEAAAVREAMLVERPIDAPHRLARPITYISTHVSAGLGLLPGFDWSLYGTEVDLALGDGSSSRVDQIYLRDDPLVVEDHIGDVLGVEIKMGACVETATFESTRSQVRRHLMAMERRWPGRVLGVATLCLGTPRRSLLTLAVPGTREVHLESTPLWSFPDGRHAT